MHGVCWVERVAIIARQATGAVLSSVPPMEVFSVDHCSKEGDPVSKGVIMQS